MARSGSVIAVCSSSTSSGRPVWASIRTAFKRTGASPSLRVRRSTRRAASPTPTPSPCVAAHEMSQGSCAISGGGVTPVLFSSPSNCSNAAAAAERTIHCSSSRATSSRVSCAPICANPETAPRRMITSSDWTASIRMALPWSPHWASCSAASGRSASSPSSSTCVNQRAAVSTSRYDSPRTAASRTVGDSSSSAASSVGMSASPATRASPRTAAARTSASGCSSACLKR